MRNKKEYLASTASVTPKPIKLLLLIILTAREIAELIKEEGGAECVRMDVSLTSSARIIIINNDIIRRRSGLIFIIPRREEERKKRERKRMKLIKHQKKKEERERRYFLKEKE